jgi:hypothetical protein
MSRTLTAGVVTQTASQTVRLALFAELLFDSGAVRAWTGTANITWNGSTWYGIGTYGGISQAEETAKLSPTSTSLTFSGIPSSMISLALSEPYQQRPGRVWLAFLDAAGAIVPDPVQIFAGRMDVMGVETSGDTASISISLESCLADMARPRLRRYTRESQRERYPNDKGFDYVAAMQQANIAWGIPGPSIQVFSNSIPVAVIEEALR